MLTLQESLFDKNLVDKKLVDWDKFKKTFIEKKPIDRYNFFNILRELLWSSCAEETFEIYWTNEQIKEYKNQQVAFEYILNALKDAFKKQGGSSWITIDDWEFEQIGNDMDDDERNFWDSELQYFSYCLAHTTAHESHFAVGEGKLPTPVKFLLEHKKVKWYTPTTQVGKLIEKPNEWAVDYFDNLFRSQVMYIYVCPKNLDPFVKKLLYK